MIATLCYKLQGLLHHIMLKKTTQQTDYIFNQLSKSLVHRPLYPNSPFTHEKLSLQQGTFQFCLEMDTPIGSTDLPPGCQQQVVKSMYVGYNLGMGVENPRYSVTLGHPSLLPYNFVTQNIFSLKLTFESLGKPGLQTVAIWCYVSFWTYIVMEALTPPE